MRCRPQGSNGATKPTTPGAGLLHWHKVPQGIESWALELARALVPYKNGKTVKRIKRPPKKRIYTQEQDELPKVVIEYQNPAQSRDPWFKD